MLHNDEYYSVRGLTNGCVNVIKKKDEMNENKNISCSSIQVHV